MSKKKINGIFHYFPITLTGAKPSKWLTTLDDFDKLADGKLSKIKKVEKKVKA